MRQIVASNDFVTAVSVQTTETVNEIESKEKMKEEGRKIAEMGGLAEHNSMTRAARSDATAGRSR